MNVCTSYMLKEVSVSSRPQEKKDICFVIYAETFCCCCLTLTMCFVLFRFYFEFFFEQNTYSKLKFCFGFRSMICLADIWTFLFSRTSFNLKAEILFFFCYLFCNFFFLFSVSYCFCFFEYLCNSHSDEINDTPENHKTLLDYQILPFLPGRSNAPSACIKMGMWWTAMVQAVEFLQPTQIHTHTRTLQMRSSLRSCEDFCGSNIVAIAIMNWSGQ